MSFVNGSAFALRAHTQTHMDTHSTVNEQIFKSYFTFTLSGRVNIHKAAFK